MITAEELRARVAYDPATGIFTRLHATGYRGGHRAGKKLGTVNGAGYVVIGFGRKIYLAHRLAWLYMTGEWPISLVDHRDLDGTNNRWGNLRPADKSLNAANTMRAFCGYSWHPQTRKWCAKIAVRGKRIYLGLFENEEQARQAYVTAALKYRGEFTRLAPR